MKKTIRYLLMSVTVYAAQIAMADDDDSPGITAHHLELSPVHFVQFVSVHAGDLPDLVRVDQPAPAPL